MPAWPTAVVTVEMIGISVVHRHTASVAIARTEGPMVLLALIEDGIDGVVDDLAEERVVAGVACAVLDHTMLV